MLYDKKNRIEKKRKEKSNKKGKNQSILQRAVKEWFNVRQCIYHML